jgi:methylglyoxal synthase
MSRTPRSIGLAASRALRQEHDAPLIRLVRRHAVLLTETLGARIVAVGGTADALLRQKLLGEYAGLERLPRGFQGGLMRLVARVVDNDPAQTLDAVIYLIEPNDPTSHFPEALACKRQCILHGKPFLATYAAADLWLAGLAVAHGLQAPEPFDAGASAVALIAHDRHKDAMVQFAERHFELLSAFGARYATGTTGTRLNAMAARRGRGEWAARDWVQRRNSGPLGGDAQIAQLVLDGQCPHVLFFEDPRVPREHEADIQLLERACRVAGDTALCVHDPATAEAWAAAITARVHVY